VRRLAEAMVALPEPGRAVPLLIEAAEELDREPASVVLPDSVAAVAAPVAVLAGDAITAERLLREAVDGHPAVPAWRIRHRLLLAWVRLRAGRYDTAVAELAGQGPAVSTGRDRLLVAALDAGLARRSGDVARLRDAWVRVEPVLARQVVDLLHLEIFEELLVGAIRLRRPDRVRPVLAALEAMVDGLRRPVAWGCALAWLRLQLALAQEDAGQVSAIAAGMARLDPPDGRQQAQCQAAAGWARALGGQVDAEALFPVLDALAGHQLPWEASRLAGQSAIRVADPGVARRLLERARELSGAEVRLDDPGPMAAGSGLSEREVEVARLVVAGRTHREIGAQLFLSPKTVEHHVARIRTKLGATSRAELLAALRPVVGQDPRFPQE
jgi:DNA-binding CsgD family transcriptional regulator